MLPALQTSLAGLLSAGNRAKVAAENIVSASAAGANAVEASDSMSARRAYNAGGKTPPQVSTTQLSDRADFLNSQGVGPELAPELAKSIVDLKLAAQAYKANANAIRTADEALSSFIKEL